jgi:DNA-binding winged helix-turn-helix (wHTH) protein
MRYDFGGFTLDTDARQLSKSGRALRLSGKALDLLRLLVEQRPRAVNKRELHDLLWPDTFVVEASLPVLIREIRGALGTQRDAVRTVHRFGYAFAGQVREASVSVAPREHGPLHRLLHAEREFSLARGENVVGRDPGADVFIPSRSVSRRHAVITIDEETAILADLRSKNGTRIDGVIITTSAPLRNGCVVTFGAVEVEYRCSFPDAETETLKS